MLGLKQFAIINPPIKGMITPNMAIIAEDLPVFFNSPISLSSPALNIKTITPNSES